MISLSSKFDRGAMLGNELFRLIYIWYRIAARRVRDLADHVVCSSRLHLPPSLCIQPSIALGLRAPACVRGGRWTPRRRPPTVAQGMRMGACGNPRGPYRRDVSLD